MGNVEILRNSLLPSSIDRVVVAINFERPQNLSHHSQNGYWLDIEVGLAILDIRVFDSKSEFTTFRFITRGDAYFEESALRFRFGTAERNPFTSILTRINNCLRVYQNRSIIRASKRSCCIKRSWIWFPRKSGYCNFRYISTCTRLQMGEFRLKKLLAELECPCHHFNFHNAGNDANVALRALIFLGIQAIEAVESKEMLERVNMLWWIVMKELISPRRKQWFYRKVRNERRTLDGQEEIREKRRQHRELNEAIIASLDQLDSLW